MESPAINSNLVSSSDPATNITAAIRPAEDGSHVHASSPGSRHFDGPPWNRPLPSSTADNRTPAPGLNGAGAFSTNSSHPRNDDGNDDGPPKPPRSSTARSNLGSVLGTAWNSNATARGSRQRDPALRPRSRLANPGSLWYGGDDARAARRLGLDRMWPGSAFDEEPSYDRHTRTSFETQLLPNTATYRDDIQSHEAPPDGGCLAWVHVLAGFIVCLNTQGLNLCFGVFNAYYTHDMFPERTRSEVAWVGSIQIFASFFCMLIGNPLVNMGYFKYCFHGGSIALFVSLLWTSFCKTFGQVIGVQGVLMGVSMGLVFSSGVLVLSTYFSERIGIAVALASVGTSLGGIIYPLIFNYSIYEVGFGWTVRIFALINLVTMLPANIIARERPRAARPDALFFDKTILTDYPYLFMLAGMFFAFWGVYFGFYFIALFGLDVLHMPPQDSLNLLVGMNGANFGGRLFSGIVADMCIGPMQTLTPLTVLSSIIMFMWLAVKHKATLFFAGCFYGFTSGGVQTLFASCGRSFPSYNGGNNAHRLAMVFIAISIATLTGAPLGGKLIEINDGDYLYAQVFTGTSLAIAAVFFLAARYTKHGWKRVRI